MPTVVRNTSRMLRIEFDKAISKKILLDPSRSLQNLCLDIIGEAGFGCNLNFVQHHSSLKLLSRAIKDILYGPFQQVHNPFWMFTNPLECLKYKENVRCFKHLALKILNQVTESPEFLQNAHILRPLLRESNEFCPHLGRNNLTKQDILDEIIVLLMTANEGPSSTLTFFFYIMAKFPEIKKNVVKEIFEIFPHNCNPKIQDLNNMRYTTAVLREILRIFPVALETSRVTFQETELGGFLIPRNTPVMVDFFSIHRDERYWDNPLVFDPTRFLGSSEQEKNYKNKCFLAFSGGGRGCLGESYADLKMKTIIAMVVRSYDWSAVCLDVPFHEHCEYLITLRCLPFKIKLSPRK